MPIIFNPLWVSTTDTFHTPRADSKWTYNVYTHTHSFSEFNDVPAVDKLEVKPVGAPSLRYRQYDFNLSFLIQTLIKYFVGWTCIQVLDHWHVHQSLISEGIFLGGQLWWQDHEGNRKRWVHQAHQQLPGNTVCTYHRGIWRSPLGEHSGGSA